jgi:coenzyme F420-0:L-glutamate ligase / coenzyme F420-1:gamma-L-glutamate ligase
MNDYEHFLKLAQSRRSIRKFSEQPVAREDIRRVLEAASWAPSSHNRQPWRFIVFEERKAIATLAETVRLALSEKLKTLPPIASGYASEFIHNATFFAQSPALIVVLHKLPVNFTLELLRETKHPELVSGEPLSAAMAVQNLLLAAHAMELGACILTAPLVVGDALLRELNPPAGYEITCLVALGYAGEEIAAPRRKSVEVISEFRQDEEAK